VQKALEQKRRSRIRLERVLRLAGCLDELILHQTEKGSIARRTRRTAPFTGRARLRLGDPGNLVTANASPSNSSNPLAVITQLQPITVVFTIAEDNVDSVGSVANLKA
jgi:hypothetical protein